MSKRVLVLYASTHGHTGKIADRIGDTLRGAADDTDEARATTRSMIDDVLDSTGWIPAETVAFAGALDGCGRAAR